VFKKRQPLVLPSVITRFGISALFKKITSFAVCAVLVLSVHDVVLCESQSESEISSQVDLIEIVTEEYKQETRDMILDLDSPLPAERILNIWQAWKIKIIDDNKNELREAGLENEYSIQCGARIHNAYNHSPGMVDNMDKFQNYIRWDEIVASLLVLDKEGNPVVLLVNMTDKMKEAYKNAVENLEKAGIDIYESLRESGTCVYSAMKTQKTGASAGLLNEWGVVNQNMSEDDAKKYTVKILSNLFTKTLLVEPKGVAYYQIIKALGIDFETGYKEYFERIWSCEVVKDNMAYDAIINHHLKGDVFDAMKSTYSAGAEDSAEMLGVSVDDPWIQRQEEVVLVVLGEDLVR